MAEQQNQPKQAPANIQIKDGFAGGEYANNMRVGIGKEEFLLMFDNIVAPSGRVVGKIIVSPGHMKRIVNVLNDSIKKYEEQFGNVEAAESPKGEIGFKG